MGFKRVSTVTVIALVAIGLILSFTTSGLLSVNQAVQSSGTVTSIGVGVYSDYGCTNILTNINWGTITPGESVTRTIYVKNTGDATITLSMTKTNWNPSNAEGYMTLTWNREGRTLDPDQMTTATLTLSVSEDISAVEAFSVDIVIIGTG